MTWLDWEDDSLTNEELDGEWTEPTPPTFDCSDVVARSATLSGAELNAQVELDVARANELAREAGMPEKYLRRVGAWIEVTDVGVTDKGYWRTLTTAQLRELPAPEFLYSDMIVARGLNMIVGASSSFKSFMAIHVSASLANEGKRVVYLLAEGRDGAALRASAWAAYHKVPDPPIEWFERDFHLVQHSEHIAEMVGKADLVVVDTLRRSTHGLGENESDDFSHIVAACDLIRARTGAAVLLLDHTGWEGKRERGTSSKRDVADAVLLMERENGKKIVTVRCLKLKEAEEWQPRIWQLVSGENGSGALVPADEFKAAESDHEAELRERFGDEEFSTLEAAAVLSKSERRARDDLNAMSSIVKISGGQGRGQRTTWRFRQP